VAELCDRAHRAERGGDLTEAAAVHNNAALALIAGRRADSARRQRVIKAINDAGGLSARGELVLSARVSPFVVFD
jgi:hypothetical protein